jgi:hypothetical protein
MAHGKQILVQNENGAKKHSFRFDCKSSDKDNKKGLFQSVYLMRDAAKKLLGIKNLDDVEEIEITVRAVGKSKDASDEEED